MPSLRMRSVLAFTCGSLSPAKRVKAEIRVHLGPKAHEPSRLLDCSSVTVMEFVWFVLRYVMLVSVWRYYFSSRSLSMLYNFVINRFLMPVFLAIVYRPNFASV